MASQVPKVPPLEQRRCPHCGARVAQQATTCFMCGQPLQVKRSRWRFQWRPTLSNVVIVCLSGLVIWQFLQRSDAATPAATANGVAEEVTLPPTLEPPTPTPVPTPTSTPIPPTPTPYEPIPVVHTVQSGESLVYIATLYEVELAELQRVNKLENSMIHPGLELLIPGLTVEPPPTPREPVYVGVTDFVYNVQAGDTVISIAYRFGTMPDAILQANGLDSSSIIHKGDTLILPIPRLTEEVLASSDLAPRTTSVLYPSPLLTGPADSAGISRKDSVNFRWLSVDILDPNEFYVLRIWTLQGDDPPTVWTKETSYRLETTFAPVESSREYLWQVTVVRVLSPSVPGASRELQSVSLTSDVRRFIWQ